MDKATPTHIILEYPTHKSDVLFRAKDGIGIAQRKGSMVIIGEDPNRGTSRIFCDAHRASVYLREVVTRADLAGHDIDFKYDSRKDLSDAPTPVLEFKAGEGMIAIPSDISELPNQIRKIQ